LTNIILLLSYLFSTQCISNQDINKIAKASTTRSLHNYLIKQHNLPLGIYEKLDVKNTPVLNSLFKSFSPLKAVKPDKNGKIRAIGLIINGAYYSRKCGNVSKYLSREIKEVEVLKTFRNSLIRRTPKIRKNVLAYALFKLGVKLADAKSTIGPRTILKSLMNKLNPSKTNIRKGMIYLQKKNGIRYKFKIGMKIPSSIKKIFIFSSKTWNSKTLTWPPVNGQENNYPFILVYKKYKK
jgi:hypothetical protein